MNERNVKWHQYTVDAVEKQLHTNASCGLSRKEARSRYRKFGANTLFDSKRVGMFQIVRAFLCDPALLLLLFASMLAICFSDLSGGLSALFCFAFGIAYAVRWFYLEKKLEGDIAQYRIPTVTVLRDGKQFTTSARNIVAGDVLLLHTGDIVPCDCRLINANGLRILTLQPNKDGHPGYHEIVKDASIVYPYGSTVFTPCVENMLYGGSEIIAGEATAIAVEIGAHTFLGAMQSFTLPAERIDKKNSDANSIVPYLKLYNFILFVLLFPLTLIGFLISSEGESILRIFLSLSALLCASSQSFLSLHLRASSLNLMNICFYSADQSNRVVFKSTRSMPLLSSATDLIVLGRCGTSDGISHLFRVATGKGEVFEKNDASSLIPLCEAFSLFQIAEKARFGEAFEDVFSVFRNELYEKAGFDRDAFMMRFLKTSFLTSVEKKDRILYAEMRDKCFKLLFSDQAAWIERCTYYDENGKMLFLESHVQKKLLVFAKEALAQGARLQIVIRQADSALCLVGIVSLREEMQTILPSVTEELKQSGVQVSFFLDEDEISARRYASEAKLPGKFLFYDKTVESNSSILDCYEEHRIFCGFSNADIAMLIKALRKRGRVVAVLGIRREQLPLLERASLFITCDDLSYEKRDLRENLLELQSRDGEENSSRCSQAMRRHADILLCRATRSFGGLSAFLYALCECRTSELKKYLILRFLISAQIPLLALTLLSICFGRGLMSAAQILYGGIFSISIGVFWLLSLPVLQQKLRRPIHFRRIGIERVLKDKKAWIPPLVASIAAFVYVTLLSLTGVIDISMCVPFLFFSMLLLQLTAMYSAAYSQGAISRGKKKIFPIMLILLPATLLNVLSALFPSFGSHLLLGDWSLLTMLSLPIPPLTYLLVSFGFSKKNNRTAK